MDAAVDRLDRERTARHESWIEAVRVGTIFAHDGKAHLRWVQSRGRTTQGIGLAGAALERTILGLAATHPDLVAMG
jgi:hypothetical protein